MVTLEQFFFKKYLTEITNLRGFLDFAWFGLDRTTNYLDVEKLVQDHFRKVMGARDDLFDSMRPPGRVLAFAQSQKNNGFQFVYFLAVVRLWSILELMVDEAVLFILKKNGVKNLSDGLRTYKAQIFEYLAAGEEEQAQFLLDCIKQDTRASLKLGAGKFEALLGSLGFGGAIDENIRRALFELSEVRNLIVHRNGLADARFLDRCNWKNAERGKPIQISSDDFRRYSAAADWYIFELLDRTLDILDHAQTDKDMVEHHETLKRLKAQFLDTLLSKARANGPLGAAPA